MYSASRVLCLFFAALHRVIPIAAMGGALLLGLAAPLNASTLTTELTAAKRVVTTDAQGRTTERWVAFTKLLPGEEVTYTITCTNQGTEPAANIVVSLPIPAEMVVAPKDDHAAEITYSIDGGQNFDRLDRLTVTAPDGASRPAQARDINFVRWKLTAALPAGSTAKVTCRAVLK
jgi:uncharacterized repeat protein (TIGR01451 family)